jgi:hypothetical protein
MPQKSVAEHLNFYRCGGSGAHTYHRHNGYVTNQNWEAFYFINPNLLHSFALSCPEIKLVWYDTVTAEHTLRITEAPVEVNLLKRRTI